MKIGTKLAFLVLSGRESTMKDFYYKLECYHKDKDTVVISEWEGNRIIGHYGTKLLKLRFVEVVEIK